MKKELRDRWVAALRSGAYLQGRGALRRRRDAGGHEYCCLGVLAEVAEASWRQASPQWNNYFAMFGGECRSDAGHVPEDLLDGDIQSKLVEMNDDPAAGKSFAEIADWIEANVPVEEETRHG